MAEMNRLFLIGRLTRDPEMRYTPSGTAVAELRLAANHTYRTRDGEKREEVCFIDASVMGRGAEVVKEYLSKGREILVEGRLRFETWETKEGDKRSKHKMMVDRFQFLGSGAGARAAGAGAGGEGYESGGSRSSQPSSDEDSDDLPF